MTPLEYFRFFAKEYSALTDPEVAALLSVASALGNFGCLSGEQLNAATALYAAHLQWLSVNSGEGGAAGKGSIKMEKEGDLARSYGNAVTGSDTMLGQSPYGLQFIEMTAACFSGPLTRYGSTIPQGVELYGSPPYN